MTTGKRQRQQYKQDYYAKNRSKILKQAKEYREENRNDILVYKKKYNKLHADERNKKQKKYAKEHTEEIAGYKKQYQKEHVKEKKEYDRDRARDPSVRFSNAKHKAKRRKLSCNISKKQFFKLIQLPCYYCNNELGSTIDSCGIGLDRLNNSRGYVIDNVVSCCYMCNVIRSDQLTPEETKIAIGAVIQFRKKL